jgi:hypothetical protein
VKGLWEDQEGGPDWGKQHVLGVTTPSPMGWPCLSRGGVPACHVNDPWPGLFVRRKGSGHDTAETIGQPSQQLPDGLLTHLACQCPPHFKSQQPCAPRAREGPPSPASPSCQPCKFSHCFEPKTGILVLCPRLFPRFSTSFRGPQKQMPSA